MNELAERLKKLELEVQICMQEGDYDGAAWMKLYMLEVIEKHGKQG